MSVFTSPNFLRNVLAADAASCALTGGAQLVFTSALADLLHLPAALLLATGAFLVVYAAMVGFVATRRAPPRPLVWFFVVGNFGWAVACGALLASGAFSPGPLGQAWVAAQAVTVVVLAELQWAGLKRAQPAGWA